MTRTLEQRLQPELAAAGARVVVVPLAIAAVPMDGFAATLRFQ